MAWKVIDNVNLCLKILHRQNYFLTSTDSTSFDHACPAWFWNHSKRLKLHLQVSQNKSIRFCLQLDERSKIPVKDFLILNWLGVHDRYLKCIVSDIFEFPNNQCSHYFVELF